MNGSAIVKVAVAAGLLCAATAASAGQLAISRGYVSCIDDLEGAYPRHARLMHAGYYYHAMSDSEMTYFVNSTAWQEGDRVSLRTRCLTDRGGFDLVSRDTEFGRWTQQRSRVTVEEVSGR